MTWICPGSRGPREKSRTGGVCGQAALQLGLRNLVASRGNFALLAGDEVSRTLLICSESIQPRRRWVG